MKSSSGNCYNCMERKRDREGNSVESETCLVSHGKDDLLVDLPCNLNQNRKDNEVDWLALPEDVASQIGDKLTNIKDYTRFGAVCRPWRSIYARNRDRSPREPLLLMLPTELNQDGQTRSLYSFSQKRVYNLPVPVPLNRSCHGSSHGWLVTVSGDYQVHLLNPFLSINNEIQLPPLTAFKRVESEGLFAETYLRKVVISANPVSNPNYVVMAIHGEFNRLSFFKPGTNTWTPLSLNVRPVYDIIYHNDRFFVLHSLGHVLEYDVNGPRPRMRQVAPQNKVYGKKYLVKSSGDLLQVVRDIDYKDVMDWNYYFTVGFTVLKLDRGLNRWIEVKSLGGRMLFLGDSASVSLSVSDMPGCKPNCIYYTDDFHDIYFDKDCIGPHDMGVFNLEDGSIEPHYPMKSMTIVPAPIMIQPTV